MSSKNVRNAEAEVRHSRAMLAGRWNALELEVAGLASSAKEELNHTVREVKQSVSIGHHVGKRPLAMFAGSVLTGVFLSRLSGFRSLAVMGLAGPMIKEALTSEHLPEAFRSRSSSYDGSGNSSESSDQSGMMETIRSKAIKSLSDIAREVAKRNLPASIAPIIDQAITNSTENLMTRSSQAGKASFPQPRVVEDPDGAAIH